MPSADEKNASPPLFIVLNAASGRQETNTTRATIEDILNEAGRRFHIEVVEDATKLATVAQQIVARARTCQGIVVAAGGDGTINEVAQAVLGSGCVFAVLPQGTFNYFSRTHGIAFDTATGTRLLLTARPHPVQVGLVNERIFLVNASIGLYPFLLEEREARKQQYGRSRVVAFAAGMVSLLKYFRPLRLNIECQGKTQTLRTPTLFVGNNRLQLQQLGIEEAGAPEEGQLAAITVRPVSTLHMLWLLLCGAMGRLGSAAPVMSIAFKSMTVSPSRLRRSRRIKVATDGEIVWLQSPLVFRVSPQPLLLLKPEADSATPPVAKEVAA